MITVRDRRYIAITLIGSGIVDRRVVERVGLIEATQAQLAVRHGWTWD